MADSASDPKVEDVLSSVRRLVSGDIPRTARTSMPKGPEALVLTDAHRVQRGPAGARSLEDRIAELEAAVDDGDEEFEPDGSEDQSQHVPDRIVYTRPPSSAEQDEMRRGSLRLSEIALIPTEPASDEDSIADSVAAVPFRHDSARAKDEQAADGASKSEPLVLEAAEAPMAVDIPTEPRRRAEVTAFTNPDDVVERIEARIENPSAVVTEMPIAAETLPDAADTEADLSENMLREDVVDPSQTDLDDFDAALTAAVDASISAVVFEEVAKAVETPAIDDDTIESAIDDDTIESAIDDDTIETASIEAGRVDDEAEEADSVTEPDTDTEVETTLDAGELRELVASLMREELQGELGERITRNVRKLVRREIRRALETSDLI